MPASSACGSPARREASRLSCFRAALQLPAIPHRAARRQPRAPDRRGGDHGGRLPVLRRSGRRVRRRIAAGGGRQRRLRGGRRRPRVRRPRGVQHAGPHGDVLQRVGLGDPGRGADRAQHVRHAGTGHALLRRGDREARTPQLSPDPGRVHELRPADPALADDRLDAHARPRLARPAEELGPRGQGRAAAVPAVHVLPDPGGRPGDRLPDADLRRLDVSRAEPEQRVLLGGRPQPGRHLLPRLVSPLGPGARRGVPLHARRRRAGPTAGLFPERARDAPDGGGARSGSSPRAGATSCAGTPASASRPTSPCGARSTTSPT